MASLASRSLARELARGPASAALPSVQQQSLTGRSTPSWPAPRPAPGTRRLTIDAGSVADFDSYNDDSTSRSNGRKARKQPGSSFAAAQDAWGGSWVAREQSKPKRKTRTSSGRPPIGLRGDFGSRLANRPPDMVEHYVTQLNFGVATADSDLVIRCLLSAQKAQDYDFIASISNDTFTAILNILKPGALMGQLLQIGQEPRFDGSVISPKVLEMQEVVNEYSAILQSAVKLRLAADCRITLPQFTLLLRCTESLQLKLFAEQLYQMMIEGGVHPNLECYNGYLGSIITQNPFTTIERQQQRFSTNNALRLQAQHFYDNFHKISANEKLGEAFATVERVIDRMVQDDVRPNVETFALYIRAAAIQGKFGAVYAVLQQVWNINVDVVTTATPSEPKAMAYKDPCYPSPQLVFEVVRAMCIKLDVLGAVKLLTYMVRHYQVAVEEQTWSLLLEWAHDLSKIQDNPTGDLPDRPVLDQSVIDMIWQTATSPPFSIKPGFEVFDKLMRSTYCEQNAESAAELMETYRRIHEAEVVVDKWAAYEKVKAMASTPVNAATNNLQSYTNAIRQWQIQLLKESHNRTYLKNWMWHLLTSTYAFDRDRNPEVVTVVVPRMLANWKYYGTRSIDYRIPTGIVQLKLWDAKDDARFTEQVRLRNEHSKALLDLAPASIDQKWIFGGPMERLDEVLRDERPLWKLTTGRERWSAARAGSANVVDKDLEM